MPEFRVQATGRGFYAAGGAAEVKAMSCEPPENRGGPQSR
jgi:hypothetical protein